MASYGTKFAADNWMHKSMGIQLGLTKSLRCQLPTGYESGAGKWNVTVYATGYQDYTFTIEAAPTEYVYGTMVRMQITTMANWAIRPTPQTAQFPIHRIWQAMLVCVQKIHMMQ